MEEQAKRRTAHLGLPVDAGRPKERRSVREEVGGADLEGSEEGSQTRRT
jgi:hypothetical protein